MADPTDDDPTATPATGDDWGSNDAVAPTGPTYLKTLDPGRAALVQAIGTGKMKLPNATTRGGAVSPQTQALIADVAQAFPGFDDADAPSRIAARKAFTSGKQGQNITSFNTALDHLNYLDQAVTGLGNVDSPVPGTTHLVNALRNGFRNADGSTAVSNFNASVPNVLDELVKAVRGTGGNEADINRLENAFNTSQSPEQQRGVIQQWARQLNGRINEIRNSYQTAVGSTAEDVPGISSDAQAHLQAFLSPDYINKGIAAVPTTGGPPALIVGPGSGPTPPSGGNPSAPPSGGPGGTPPGWTGPSSSGGPATLATGATRTEDDPQKSAQLEALIRNGGSMEQINAIAPGTDPAQVQSVRDYLAKHPNYTGFARVQNEVPNSIASQVAASPTGAVVGLFNKNAGDAISRADPTTASIIGAGNGVTGGHLTDLVGATGGDKAHADAALSAVEAAHPVGSFLGNVAGGTVAALGGEALLARAGVGAGAAALPLRSVLADTGYGAVAGANGDHPIAGAALGGLTGLAGGYVGRGLGAAIAPAAGKLGALYDAGVRPTLGQRFANSGRLGAALNMVEEASQSLPVLGIAPRAARQASRDDFERGAFNSALGEIGQKLPDDVELGTAPHAFMQDAFSKEYDAARSGMRFVPDAQYQADRATFAKDLTSGVLSGDQVLRVKSILDNAVTSRLQAGSGSLSGDAYKAASSDIGKAASKLSSTEPAVSDALRDYSTIFDDAARRNSSPEAVQKLDNADTGYAKAVRIEMAAAARGGDTGRFTPTQFDAAVQKASGGVRSRAYLSGNALMGDYAEAGKSLVDRLPNSGTADRLITKELLTGQGSVAALGGGLGFVGALHPGGAALAGAVTAPYAPGIAALTKRLASPRSGNTAVSRGAQTLGDILRQQYGGAIGAPLAVSGMAALSSTGGR